MKIKICGLSREEDILYVNKYMPDFVGFIFADQSKRKISFDKAKFLKSKLNDNIKSVGVFVNEDISNILKIINAGIIDLVQLHGAESEKYIFELKKFITNPIIKAFKADDYMQETSADYILLDSCVNGQFGGTGKTFAWTKIPENIKSKLFLAGGLNPLNIENAVKVKPYCLDINSGVETDGKKDCKKIADVIKKIKGMTNE